MYMYMYMYMYMCMCICVHVDVARQYKIIDMLMYMCTCIRHPMYRYVYIYIYIRTPYTLRTCRPVRSCGVTLCKDGRPIAMQRAAALARSRAILKRASPGPAALHMIVCRCELGMCTCTRAVCPLDEHVQYFC